MNLENRQMYPFEAILDLDLYDNLNFHEQKLMLVEKRIFIASEKVEHSGWFYFDTSVVFSIGEVYYEINPNVYREFYYLLFDYIEESGKNYFNDRLKYLKDLTQGKAQKANVRLLASIKSEIERDDIKENDFILFISGEGFFDSVIEEFGDELFVYLTKGINVFYDEIDNYFKNIEIKNIPIDDDYLEFLYSIYCSHVPECLLEPDANYHNYMDGQWVEWAENFMNELYLYSDINTFHAVQQDGYRQSLIDKYKPLAEEYLGHTLMVYDECPKEYMILNKWLRLNEIKFIYNNWKKLIFVEKDENKKDKKKYNIFKDGGEEVLDIILNEFDAIENGKAKERGFQPICDAIYKTHEDYFNQIFKRNITKKKFILFLKYRYDAKINDLTRISSGAKHQPSVNKFIGSIIQK